MQYLDIRQIKGKVRDDETIIRITAGEIEQRVTLEYCKVGFGQKRFFKCPRCSKRVERLFFVDDRWRCAKCSGVNLYKGIQNNTKGGYKEIAYRMKQYADRYNIQFDFPFDYLDFVFDKRMHRASFRKHIRVLQSLENMRNNALFYGATYKAKEFKMVTSGKHPLMHKVTMKELKEKIYKQEWYI